jgi:hypothetical protein
MEETNSQVDAQVDAQADARANALDIVLEDVTDPKTRKSYWLINIIRNNECIVECKTIYGRDCPKTIVKELEKLKITDPNVINTITTKSIGNFDSNKIRIEINSCFDNLPKRKNKNYKYVNNYVPKNNSKQTVNRKKKSKEIGQNEDWPEDYD